MCGSRRGCGCEVKSFSCQASVLDRWGLGKGFEKIAQRHPLRWFWGCFGLLAGLLVVTADENKFDGCNVRDEDEDEGFWLWRRLWCYTDERFCFQGKGLLTMIHVFEVLG